VEKRTYRRNSISGTKNCTDKVPAYTSLCPPY